MVNTKYIWITYGQHMGVDHVYVNSGVWTLVSKIGNQVFANNTTCFSFIQSELNCI
jgi:hypothetical protein